MPSKLKLRDIAALLEDTHPQPLQWDGFRKAAVIVPLVEQENGLELLFTVRSSQLSNHAGEVAFPGGRVDAGESLSQAACREIQEELGIHIHPKTLLGALDDHPSPAKYTTTPLVAALPNDVMQQLTLNPAEVASVFTVPLARLVAMQPTHKDVYVLGEGRGRRLHYFTVDDYVIWGMTGNILINLLNVMRKLPEDRPWLIPDRLEP